MPYSLHCGKYKNPVSNCKNGCYFIVLVAHEIFESDSTKWYCVTIWSWLYSGISCLRLRFEVHIWYLKMSSMHKMIKVTLVLYICLRSKLVLFYQFLGENSSLNFYFCTWLKSFFPNLSFLCHVCGRAAERWFKEAKERHPTLNAIIYGSIIYANWYIFFEFWPSAFQF